MMRSLPPLKNYLLPVRANGRTARLLDADDMAMVEMDEAETAAMTKGDSDGAGEFMHNLPMPTTSLLLL